jgi:glycopeptide antibiotics resistance protein
MKQRRFLKQNYTSLIQRVFLKDISLVFYSTLVVLVATLYPFNFVFPNNFSIEDIFSSFSVNTTSFIDQVNNILLFIPVGFSCTNCVEKTGLKKIHGFFLILLVSAGLSSTVEFLQIFLPSRAPTPEDILNNTLGGFVGFLCFNLWKSQNLNNTFKRIENSQASQSLSRLLLFFLGYILLSLIISFSWLNTTSLSTWNPNYPLLLGNERIGDRSWEGYISTFSIADKAISANDVETVLANQSSIKNTLGDSLIASYELTGQCCYADKTGKLSEFIWRGQGQPSDTQTGKGVFLNNDHWLETKTSVPLLNKRISETSELTISTTVASANPVQTGPARIISLSKNYLRRNLTIGQQGTDLDLRIRTSITGENAADLQMRIPNVFTDTKPHHIIITYAKANLKVYIDTLQNSHSFNLVELIPKDQKFFYYAMTFVPVGFCLAVLTVLAKRKLFFYRLLLPTGILLPSLMLEGLLVSESGKHMSLKSLLIGIFFTAGTMLVLRVRAAMAVK